MADVTVKCVDCGEKMQVSEYVDREQVKCSVCGGRVRLPKGKGKRPRGSGESPRKKKKKVVSVASSGGANPNAEMIGDKPPEKKPGERTTVTAAYAVGRGRRKRKRRILVWSPNKAVLWAIFLLGTGILAGLRFGPFRAEESFIKIGVYVYFFVNLCVVVDAFQENLMHGLLSMTIPGYSLWYVFTLCDSFILRLAMAIIVLPFCKDIALAYVFIFQTGVGWLGADHFNQDF